MPLVDVVAPRMVSPCPHSSPFPVTVGLLLFDGYAYHSLEMLRSFAMLASQHCKGKHAKNWPSPLTSLNNIARYLNPLFPTVSLDTSWMLSNPQPTSGTINFCCCAYGHRPAAAHLAFARSNLPKLSATRGRPWWMGYAVHLSQTNNARNEMPGVYC